MIILCKCIQWCVEIIYMYTALPYERNLQKLYIWLDDIIEKRMTKK